MSDTNTTPTLDPGQAQDFLTMNVYAPAFFDKLASYRDPVTGLPLEPTSQEEAIQMIRMAGKLRNHYESEASLNKQASAPGGSLLDQLESRLDQLGGQPSQDERAVKTAASSLAEHPQVQAALGVLYKSQAQPAAAQA